MANEKLYGSKMLLGALYRAELARGLKDLGYGIEKTHADGRFEIAGVSREAVEAFSTRRAEIEAAMAARDLGSSADNPRLAERAALMTRAKKRDIDRGELRGVWQKQAADLGLDAKELVAEAEGNSAAPVRDAGVEPAAGPGQDRDAAAPRAPGQRRQGAYRGPGRRHGVTGAVARKEPATFVRAWICPGTCSGIRRGGRPSRGRWRISRSARRSSAAPICWPRRSPMRPARSAWARPRARSAPSNGDGTLHAVDIPGAEDSLATDRTVGDERETVARMGAGQGRGAAPMRG